MDQEKYVYFLGKYRALDQEDLIEASQRIDSLAEEASAALRSVLSEKGEFVPPPSPEEDTKPIELTGEDRKLQTKLSSDLWNGPLTKRVHFLFSAQALVLAYSFLGPQGLKLGALPIGALAALLMYGANRIGRRVTRRICANADTSFDHKTKTLKSIGIALWPALLASALVGIVLARASGA